MSKVCNLSKYCAENQMNINSLVTLCKRSNQDVYRVGDDFFVDDEENLNKAFIVDFERKRQRTKEKSQTMKLRAQNAKEERRIMNMLAASGTRFGDSSVNKYLDEFKLKNANKEISAPQAEGNIVINKTEISEEGGNS